jgi:hypothetical protein
MRLPAKIGAWVLPLFLTGCFLHRFHKTPAPPVAPKIDTTSSNAPPPTQLPPPELTIPTKPPVSETELPAQSPRPPARHRKPSANPNPAGDESQQTASEEPAVSAIGQLSSGDPAGFRHQAEVSIAETERGLNGLNRQLNDQEKKTAAHIREFLKQAKAALASGDVDGASTLAAKAKVLLNELIH